MDLAALTKDFGLPTGLAIYFIWRDYKTQSEYRRDLKDALLKATAALEKNNELLQQFLIPGRR